MSKFADFIVEIGTEELPLKELQPLASGFAELLKSHLATVGLSFDEVKTFTTPRRLAVVIKDLATQQPEQEIARSGPSIKAAYNADGSPTKAALGFASSCDTTLADITTKDEKLYFAKTVAGQKTLNLLPTIIEQAIAKLPIKKAMRWGNGEFAFVRPVHWVLALLGKDIIPVNIFGVAASNYTYGHRIHCPKPIKISAADEYEKKLESDGKVIADFNKRQTIILDAIHKLSAQENGKPIVDPNLLNIVTGLVEYPIALLASFNPEFLHVPKECLISSMQDHQKCFALADKSTGELLPKFILISNLQSTDPQTVIRGNELVMNARLADAAFYFNKDQQQSLESRVAQLKTVTYQKQLGSIFDKVERIQQLAIFISPYVNKDANLITIIKRAAYLCKADLLTSMVYEFPELQGTMGWYYASLNGEGMGVASAIKEHYLPKFANDELPTSAAGIAIAIADRVDSLVGMFGIGNIPTGEKDPYGLRRQAIAVLRILIEKNINIDLNVLFNESFKTYQAKITNPSHELLTFCFERLKAWYLDKGISAKTFAAVMANPPSNPLDFAKRIHAVNEFQALPQAASLAAANKRVQNLLVKNPSNNQPLNEKLFTEPAEQQLFSALQKQWDITTPLLENHDYTAVLKSLANLQQPVDNFFDNTMVMVEDAAVRNNRLNLLEKLRKLFLEIADVSLL